MPAPCVTFEFDLHHRVAPSHDRAIADDPLSNSEGVGVSLSPAECCLHGRQGMEHLWSRAVATGGNRWQMGLPRKRLEQAKTVAMGCDQLPGPQNGKEGVDVLPAPGLCDPFAAIPRRSRFVYQHGNDSSRTDPARGSRKFPQVPADPRNAVAERPAHGGNPRLFPLNRKRHDRPVTPEVAGSSPVAPVFEMPANGISRCP